MKMRISLRGKLRKNNHYTGFEETNIYNKQKECDLNTFEYQPKNLALLLKQISVVGSLRKWKTVLN